MIKLTDAISGTVIRINPAHIHAYMGMQNGSNVQMTEQLLYVKEKPETIDSILKGEKE